jgi:mono/diheme cytochrome c family protein
MLFFRLVIVAAWAMYTALAAARPDPAGVERGRKEFVRLCGFCHGNETGNAQAGKSFKDVHNVFAYLESLK